ncbi:putative RNA helicase [Helianthus annuus]|uniref:RNA helicase n=2 Tax=Helianthus annuus TaxID=4232 RepID=A0A251SLH3_HELAN|nr:DExH-box ATP-dependent RNA helicase DExH5, mitochondrial isoform X1 [Helianthus annuus]KAF5777335.1 putative RNA helicase [Helianthus annuus]KAJ0488894.1 putative RNA helicase [Helianthus annuus]KAJ0504734.1 putative RNA helicase [Helianthus annuus]KAJ0674466.1 putative RNA helicase [Helianthus annuus]KAJ0862145.1 putative RNA helicase [Helianthus annuus]
MKDAPRPPSYGSVYVPPHQRLRSVVTSPASAPDISTSPAVVDNNNYNYNNNNNSNYFVNASYSGNNVRFPSPYNPYLPPQQQPQQMIPQVGASYGRFEPSVHPGASTSDIDSWKWKLTTLLQSRDKQELISREKKDRRDYEQIAALATSMGLHSHLYAKVLVVSKVPLPNYRFDLDDKRPQREVSLPPELQKRVDAHLEEYLSHKAKSNNGSRDSLYSTTSSNGNDEGLFEQPDLGPQIQVAIQQVYRIRSVQLQADQQAWQDSSDGWRMGEFRKSLPAYKEKDTILNAISQNQVVIISGETGCGKTTQIPQYILEQETDSLRGATCSIICTQPRRISAMSVSERIATERGEKLGDTVGYKVRLESIKGRDTRLLFCTTGYLLRRLLIDSNLKGVTHVIVDEIHERGMNEDFLLIVLKELLPRRPDLRVVLMSATLDADLFSSYFGGSPSVKIPGFTHPVHSYFLEDVLEKTGYRLTAENQIDDYGQERPWKSNKQFIKKRKSQIASAVEGALLSADFRNYSQQTRESMSCWNPDCMGFNLIEFLLVTICENEKPGAVLVFLTGWDDISSLKEKLQAHYLLGDSARVLLLACHGSMASSEQKLIFEKPEGGVRKIVLATNMAETSITIDDVVFVIDCGKAKETSYDALNNTPCLLPSWISKVSAKQRRGRAGRVQPGECYHLYPRCVYNAFAEYQLPEILRTPLQSLCLQIKSLKLGSISEFLSKALQSPKLLAVQNAIEYLKVIGALDESENLTVLGRYLSMLPVEPKLGKMLILGAVFNCLDPILTVVAGLTVRDPFLAPLDKKDLAEAAKAQFSRNHSDHIALVRAYEGWKVAEYELTGHEYCWKNFLSAQSMKAICSLRQEFQSLLNDTGLIDCNITIYNTWSYDENLLRAIICYGLYPGICSVVHNEKSFSLKTMEDGQVHLHSNSVNARDSKIPYPWLVFNEKIKVNSIFLKDSTAISDSVLLLFGGTLSKGDIDGHLKMMGGYLEFFMDPGLAKMYQSLRRELDELIQCKLTNPRMDIHTHHELLSAIRLLLPEDKCNGKFVFNRQVLYKDSKPYIASVPAPAPPASRLESGPGGDNPKGQLQTLLTRAGCPAPTYRTSQLPDNQFRSICEFNGMQIMGHPCHNKKQAEKDAAAEALERLTGGNNGNTSVMLKKSKKSHN